MPLPVYESGQAAAYCAERMWAFRPVSNNELLLEACPFCGKPKKCYWNNENGAYSCKVCGATGNYFTLLREMGDAPVTTRALAPSTPDKKKSFPVDTFLKFEVALADDQDAQAYLTERGITLDTARVWHLGIKIDNGIKWLMIPYVTNNLIVDVKYRSLPPAPKAYRRMGGGDSVLFGEHTLAEAGAIDVLYLCEGEIDAMTLWQHGYTPVVSTTTGAQSFSPRWYDVIVAAKPKEIVLLYDSDVAGQEGAKARMKQFDDYTVKNIILPCKDVNEFFQTHDNAELDTLIANVVETDVPHVYSMDTVLNWLETELFINGAGFRGVTSVFPEVNDLIGGGYWDGFLVTISGIAGAGKTTYVLQELFAAADRGIPSYMLCLEMPEVMMMRKIIEHRFHHPKEKLTVEDIQKYRPHMERVPIYLGSGVRTIKELEETIRAAKKRYDVKIMAFDNINYFIRSRDHQAQEIGMVTQLLKMLAVELSMVIIAVAQPAKFNDNDRVMTQNDVRDSASVVQDSDCVILVSRRRNAATVKDFGAKSNGFGNYYPETLVRIEKARYAAGGECYLYFDGAISTYRSLTNEERDNLAAYSHTESQSAKKW